MRLNEPEHCSRLLDNASLITASSQAGFRHGCVSFPRGLWRKVFHFALGSFAGKLHPMSAEQENLKDRKTLDERAEMTELERIRHSCAHVMAVWH